MIPAEKCAFCPATADMTGEHVWSDWMNRVIKARGFNLVQHKTGDKPHREYKRKTLDLKLPVVCASCNNNWMSDIENDHAKPAMEAMILSANGAILSPEKIKPIAIFAFKTLVVADHAYNHDSEHREPFFSESVRYAFRESRQLPVGLQMWLACTQHSQGIFRPSYFPSAPTVKRAFEVYSLTYGSGHFVFQITACKWLDNKRTSDMPQVVQDGRWDRYSMRVWPTTGVNEFWPPKKLMMRQMLHNFADRWIYLKVPVNWVHR